MGQIPSRATRTDLLTVSGWVSYFGVRNGPTSWQKKLSELTEGVLVVDDDSLFRKNTFKALGVAEPIGKRVLLVEDDRFTRKLISGYLLPAGYVVKTAEDGLEAIAKLRAGLPDLIICDLNMPRMSGPEFLDIVRKRFPQVPSLSLVESTPKSCP